MNVFERYAPFIQDYIYRSGWKCLRGIQNAAGEAIFTTDQNVLLTASTASGKTEAAFFPILSLLEENPSASVGVLYIAPLKALINDQFLRLNELCDEAGIPSQYEPLAEEFDMSVTQIKRIVYKGQEKVFRHLK